MLVLRGGGQDPLYGEGGVASHCTAQGGTSPSTDCHLGALRGVEPGRGCTNITQLIQF